MLVLQFLKILLYVENNNIYVIKVAPYIYNKYFMNKQTKIVWGKLYFIFLISHFVIVWTSNG